MKISIVIPAYNAERYIARTLDCCLAQTFDDYEIIVVDDGSKDETNKVVANYQNSNDNVRLVYKGNGGLVSARKEGMKYVRGEFVFFLDSDDVIDTDTLKVLSEYTDSYDIVIADFQLESGDGEVLPLQHQNVIKYEGGAKSTYMNYLSKNITASLCGRLIRSEFLRDIQTPNYVTTGEDVITNFYIVRDFNPKIKVVNKPLYHYIQYPNSMINTKSRGVLQKRIQYAQWIVDFMESEKLIGDSDVKSCLSYLVLDEYYSYLRDGGKPSDCSDFSIMANSIFWDKNVLRWMPGWRRLTLEAFHRNLWAGYVTRFVFNSIRRILK